MKTSLQLTFGACIGLMALSSASAQSLKPAFSAKTYGAASEVAIANAGSGYVVTSLKNGNGDLEVIAWQDTGTSLVRLGSATGGPITFGTAIVAVTPNLVVTAAFNSNFTLELISWQFNPKSDSPIARLSSATAAGQVGGTSVAIAAGGLSCAFPDNLYCVMTTTNSGAIQEVSEWGVSNKGVITAQGTLAGFSASEVAVAAVGDGISTCCGLPYFVTAVKSGSNLEIQGWAFAPTAKDPDGVLTSGSPAYNGGAVGPLAVAVAANNGVGCFIATTAAINASGDLEITSVNFFIVSGYGYIDPVSQTTAGAASQVAIDSALFSIATPPSVVTAVLNGSGNLSIELWNTDPSMSIQKIASYNTSSPIVSVAVAAESDDAYLQTCYNPIACSVEFSEPWAFHIVTAARTSKGDLEMQVWQYTPAE